MSAALENAVIEEYAKFEGFKELMEDDLLDPEPDKAVCISIKENEIELKKQALLCGKYFNSTAITTTDLIRPNCSINNVK